MAELMEGALGRRSARIVRKAELELYRSAPPRADFRPYAILAHYRSGTTLLTKLLQSHPEVDCAGEVLIDYLPIRPRWIPFPMRYVTRRAAWAGTEVGGLTLRIDQLHICLMPMVHPAPAEFIRRLSQSGWKFIHLVRENALLQAVSNMLANLRDEWHYRPGETVPQGPMHLDASRLRRSIKWGERMLAAEHAALADIPHLEIRYERDLQEGALHQPTMDRVFDFLGVGSHPVQAPLKKIGTRSLEQRIENFGEVVRMLEESGLDRYLLTA